VCEISVLERRLRKLSSEMVESELQINSKIATLFTIGSKETGTSAS